MGMAIGTGEARILPMPAPRRGNGNGSDWGDKPGRGKNGSDWKHNPSPKQPGPAPGPEPTGTSMTLVAVDILRRYDRNNNGKIDLFERVRFVPNPGSSNFPFLFSASTLVRKADKNADAVLSYDELFTFVKTFDADGNGRLGDVELAKFHAATGQYRA